MNRLVAQLGCTALVLSMFTATALAQSLSTTEVPELESEQLVDEGLVAAKILEIDSEDRMLVVRFEENQETARLFVPESADIIRTFPNNVQRDIELSELSPGDNIELQAVVIEEVLHLTIIGIAA
jgi:hypothetical protein